MSKKVESIKHKTDTRAHIPSKEEAGYEDANAKVQDGKKVLELPKTLWFPSFLRVSIDYQN
jgi:adenine-specific DNA-methyltransferase